MTKTAASTRPDVDDPLMSVNQIAAFLSVHRAYVYRLMAEGQLPYQIVGTRRRVRQSAVAKYLAAQEVAAQLSDG